MVPTDNLIIGFGTILSFAPACAFIAARVVPQLTRRWVTRRILIWDFETPF
ncbi:hypothetical protein JOH50_006654 [Rhizobium leguminosarum]|nr:hypothetical protein [Rhizobium leguminosarum]